MAATALFEAAGDVQATLDAAFALIEDCLDPAQGLGAAFLSESSASASGTVLPPTTGGKRKRRAASNTTSSKAASDAPAKKLTFQYRQKEEIQRLRAEAASLETQLNLLQWLSDGSDPPASIPGSKLVAISRAPSRWQLLDMWKSMASRHKKLRVASENENAILRARVADQLKTIQAIQKLLRRPANHDQIQRVPRPINAIRTDLSEPNSVVLERLCVDLDQMYIDVDKTLQVVGLDGLDVVPIQQRVHQLSPTTSMSLLIESRIMPFNFIETSTTMWDFSLEVCTVTDLFKKQTTVNRQGTILRRYEMEQTEAGAQFVVAGDHALRKYTENERFVAVNSGLARPLCVRGVDTSGVICLERGRVVCSPVGDRTSNLCRVQTCFEVVVEVDKSLKNAAELATDFRDLLVSHKTHMFHTFKNGLESALLRKHRAQLPTSG